MAATLSIPLNSLSKEFTLAVKAATKELVSVAFRVVRSIQEKAVFSREEVFIVEAAAR